MDFIREKDIWTDKFFENAGWTQDEDGVWSGVVANLYKLYGRDTDGFFGANVNITQPVVISFTAKYDRVNEDYNSGMNLRLHYTDGTVSAVTVNTTTYSAYKLVSTAGKVIDKIVCSYSTGSNTTYFKDVKMQVIGEINEVVDKSENLIPFPYVDGHNGSKVSAGITYTVNSDSSVTAIGTSTGLSVFTFVQNFFLPQGDYIVFGCPVGGSTSSYRISIEIKKDNSAVKYLADSGNGVTFSLAEGEYLGFIQIRVNSGITMNNIVFYPQLEEGSTVSVYQPFIKLYSPYIIRNLLTLPYQMGETQTKYGVTATVDSNTGWVSLSGTYTCTGATDFSFRNYWSLPTGKYYVAGCPEGGLAPNTYGLFALIRRADGKDSYVSEKGNGYKFEIYEGDTILYFSIRIGADFGTHENLVFKPLLIKLPEEV